MGSDTALAERGRQKYRKRKEKEGKYNAKAVKCLFCVFLTKVALLNTLTL